VTTYKAGQSFSEVLASRLAMADPGLNQQRIGDHVSGDRPGAHRLSQGRRLHRPLAVVHIPVPSAASTAAVVMPASGGRPHPRGGEIGAKLAP
jgi:hypothetical protein